MNNWGLVIKELRDVKDLTQQDLGKLTGTKRSLISHYEKGYVKSLPDAKLSVFASALGVTAAELSAKMEAANKDTNKQPTQPIVNAESPPLDKMPIIGAVPAGLLDMREQESLGYIYVPQEKLAGMKKENLFALLVTGESMIEAGIRDKDFIVVNKAMKEIVNGKIYIIQGENGFTVKKVYKEANQIRLKAANPDYEDTVLTGNVEIVGRVVLVQPPTFEV